MSFSYYVLPTILCIFALGCIISKKDVQEAFILGAKEGMSSAFSLIPTLVLLMTATSIFAKSGACEIISSCLEPVLSKIGVPSELTALIVVRPISGSGSTALLSDVLLTYGPDTYIGLCASVICASSDTIFYIISLYFGSIGIKKTGPTLPIALTVMVIGIILSCIFVRIMF